MLCEQWAKIEKEVGGGQVEEMLYDARAELNLIGDYIGTQPLPLLPSPTTFTPLVLAVPNAVSDPRCCCSLRALVRVCARRVEALGGPAAAELRLQLRRQLSDGRCLQHHRNY